MITLYKPEKGDLWFRQALLGDEVTMAYNAAWGGTIAFPEEKWDAWYDRWLSCTDGSRFYRYVTLEGTFLGEAAYYWDTERQITIVSLILHVAYRGKGYGRQALLALCDAARERGIPELWDDIAIDNPSQKLFLSCGFREMYRTESYVMLKICM